MQLKKLIKKILKKPDNDDEVSVARSLGVRIGENCSINDNARRVFSMEPYLVTLGNRVTVAPEVRFVPHDGAISVLRTEEEYKNKDLFAPIVIGDNVFIGIGTIIMPGVKVGSNVIIGARSLVTKDIPSDTVACGNPAKAVCSIQTFKENLVDSRKQLVPTKGMTAEKKQEFLRENFPEWFR